MSQELTEPTVPDAPLHLASPEEDWDDSTTSLFLRALLALVIGGGLLWGQWNAPIAPGVDYARWTLLSVWANFILPVCVVWFLFAQTLVPMELKNQALNAWNYGWKFSDWKKQLPFSLTLGAAMLPFLFLASRDPAVRGSYAQWFPSGGGFTLLVNCTLLAIYLFCWEWFFRGFLLFGMAQGFTWPIAIVVQAVVFGFAHAGKPQVEMMGAFAGGAVLGVIAWRQKSFFTAFLTHFWIHLAWVLLIRF